MTNEKETNYTRLCNGEEIQCQCCGKKINRDELATEVAESSDDSVICQDCWDKE